MKSSCKEIIPKKKVIRTRIPFDINFGSPEVMRKRLKELKCKKANRNIEGWEKDMMKILKVLLK
jgi:hypothetical protein